MKNKTTVRVAPEVRDKIKLFNREIAREQGLPDNLPTNETLDRIFSSEKVKIAALEDARLRRLGLKK